MKKIAGVTLIEMVMVIVVVAVVATGIMPFFLQSQRSALVNEELLTGTQLVKSCSEHVLVSKRWAGGFDLVDNTICDSLPLLTDYGVSVVVTVIDNTVDPFCPVNASCKRVTIQSSRLGRLVSEVQILLVV